jgi:hypothetical protein
MTADSRKFMPGLSSHAWASAIIHAIAEMRRCTSPSGFVSTAGRTVLEFEWSRPVRTGRTRLAERITPQGTFPGMTQHTRDPGVRCRDSDTPWEDDVVPRSVVGLITESPNPRLLPASPSSIVSTIWKFTEQMYSFQLTQHIGLPILRRSYAPYSRDAARCNSTCLENADVYDW